MQEIFEQPTSQLYPERTDETEAKAIRDTIERRFSQSKVSRLCEYITGLSLENPDLVEQIKADQKSVRAAYALPDRDARWEDPDFYEEALRRLAHENGIKIVEASECSEFFANNPMAKAVFLDEQATVAIDIDRTTSDSHVESLGMLEHETVHGLQEPSLSIERKEYEAYVAGVGEQFIQAEENREALFGLFIAGSVAHYYDEQSERSGEQVRPVWSDAEHFLREVDGIDPSTIGDDNRALFEELSKRDRDYEQMLSDFLNNRT